MAEEALVGSDAHARVRNLAFARLASQLPNQLAHLGESLGGDGFAEAIHHAGALHPETRQMLASAELAGDLEATLARAIRRRQESFDLRARRLTTALVTTILVLVYGFVIYIVYSFYSAYYASLGRLGR